MFRASSFAMLLGTLGLGACVVPQPAGPSVLVVPPEGKNLAQFQHEDINCRGYALQKIGYGSPQQAANGNAVGSAAIGASTPVRHSARRQAALGREQRSGRNRTAGRLSRRCHHRAGPRP